MKTEKETVYDGKWKEQYAVFSAAPDGKVYDAYVSFLHSDTLSTAEAESFALQILPEQLEKQHGYSLYIRGRDDSPGEGREHYPFSMLDRFLSSWNICKANLCL